MADELSVAGSRQNYVSGSKTVCPADHDGIPAQNLWPHAIALDLEPRDASTSERSLEK